MGLLALLERTLEGSAVLDLPRQLLVGGPQLGRALFHLPAKVVPSVLKLGFEVLSPGLRPSIPRRLLLPWAQVI